MTFNMDENRLIDSFIDYNSDEDYNGAMGHGIAEQMHKKYGPDFNKIKLKVSLRKLERAVLSKNNSINCCKVF